jgi:hypothetical protein
MKATAPISPSVAATVLVEERIARSASATLVATAHYTTDRLHPGVFTMAIASYAVLLLAFWLLFASDIVTFLSLSICTVYYVMFFGVPLAMYRTAARSTVSPAPGSLARFLRGNLEINTGLVSGWGALTQVLLIPVSVTFGIVAIGLILHAYL